MTLIQTFDTLTNRTSHSLVSAESDNAISDNAISQPDLQPDSHSDLPPDSHHRPHHSDLLGSYLDSGIQLPPLPIVRPLLMVGHGTRNPRGRQDLIDFAKIYQELDASRPVIPCFLELTEPSIQAGVDQCISQGYTDISVLPILLFAARHNKFDVTNELDRAKARYPQLTFHYGRHFGITPAIFELWQARLALLDTPEHNPNGIAREDTVLLFIGRGSSDPDANGDVYKLARMMWEGSGYHTVETCFIGITHPRLEEGFRRSRLYHPKRIIVLPYFMFTGVLMEKIERIAAEQQLQYPDTEVAMLPEMGIHPLLLSVLRDREIETQQGQVQMNCEMCKFRIVATTAEQRSGHGHNHDHSDHGHDHAQGHDHAHEHASHEHASHGHTHGHDHGANADPYAEPEKYHNRIWQVP
ncbi:MAG: sirohydrochlorin cobaltochelatase CbiX [Phormidesmis priestleyi Ana]|uniref:Sirohydrochlorin cobaltochelatase CbiX n=1 Tax=Phormidesmis priestleyi Ana TaxID=1666911 RepID=A0A0P8BSS7_9CYAN|nr:MAG: sirohydrochlorin cobaltochelatase CbiX [Phormidesmis priestleyi Ana]